MVSNDFPVSDITEIKIGNAYHPENKSVIFSPKKIKEINYSVGAHTANPKGVLKYAKDELKLLHYKFIGGIERIYPKYEKNQSRMSSHNKARGFGVHYFESKEQVAGTIANGLIISEAVI
jgi:hypothetical protein